VVIAAYIADARNAKILSSTLDSIACFQPSAEVLVVDNASPLGSNAVNSAIALTRHSSSLHINVHRTELSRGQLGSWAEADAFLRSNHDPRLALTASKSAEADVIVLLQHSTALAAPVLLPAGCDAVSLAPLVNQSSGGGWMAPSEYGVRWASAMAEAIHLECASPCTRGLLPPRFSSAPTAAATLRKPPSPPPLEWSAAAHAVLAMRRPAWERLRALRIWPGTRRTTSDGNGSSSTAYPPVRPLVELWKRAPCANGGVKGVVPCSDAHSLRVGLLNGGLEKLAGILHAHLNRYGPRGATHPAACSIPDGVVKVHGGNLRPAELERRQQGQIHMGLHGGRSR
jgi:hypothetical protein